MKKYIIIAAIGLFCLSCLTLQAQRQYDSNKTGIVKYETNLNAVGVTKVVNPAFTKNVADFCSWFVQSNPLLKNRKGFDLKAFASYAWSDNYTLLSSEYAIPANIEFFFQLFLKNGDKWVNEPPFYNITINNIEAGHEMKFWKSAMDINQYPQLKNQIKKAEQKLYEFFPVYPKKTSLAKGVDMYSLEDNTANGYIMVYNPERPSYWLPVTVREVTDALLQYYSLFNATELERMALEELKKEINQMPEEEMNAPAYFEPSVHPLCTVNGQQAGLPLMRFNAAYWNKKLPISAIQLMGFYNPNKNAEEMEEQISTEGYPFYDQLLYNQIEWQAVAQKIAL